MDELLAVQELVDVCPGEPVPTEGSAAYDFRHIDTGRLRLHASPTAHLLTLCGSEDRRVLPTGLPWTSPHLDGIERCARCAELTADGRRPSPPR